MTVLSATRSTFKVDIPGLGGRHQARDFVVRFVLFFRGMGVVPDPGHPGCPRLKFSPWPWGAGSVRTWGRGVFINSPELTGKEHPNITPTTRKRGRVTPCPLPRRARFPRRALTEGRQCGHAVRWGEDVGTYLPARTVPGGRQVAERAVRLDDAVSPGRSPLDTALAVAPGYDGDVKTKKHLCVPLAGAPKLNVSGQVASTLLVTELCPPPLPNSCADALIPDGTVL